MKYVCSSCGQDINKCDVCNIRIHMREKFGCTDHFDETNLHIHWECIKTLRPAQKMRRMIK
jgi:hypothetical protein